MCEGKGEDGGGDVERGTGEDGGGGGYRGTDARSGDSRSRDDDIDRDLERVEERELERLWRVILKLSSRDGDGSCLFFFLPCPALRFMFFMLSKKNISSSSERPPLLIAAERSCFHWSLSSYFLVSRRFRLRPFILCLASGLAIS